MALLDVRTYRGANIDSNHYLVVAKLRMRVTNAKMAKGKCQEKYISKLWVLQTFRLEVTECLCQIPYSHEGAYLLHGAESFLRS